MEKLRYPNDPRITTKTSIDSGNIIGVENNGQPIQFPYSLFLGSGGDLRIATIWGELASGVSEGDLSLGITKRLLNESQDPHNLILTLSDSIFTLGAGTYLIGAFVPNFFSGGAGQRKAKLYLLDDSDDSILIIGASSAVSASTYAQSSLELCQLLVLDTEKACYLGHYSSSIQTFGTGLPTGDGNPEVYSQVALFKM
jgi:hypothetical protein